MIRLVAYVAMVFFCSSINAQYYSLEDIHKAENIEMVPLLTLPDDATSSQLLRHDSDTNNSSSCFKNALCEKLKNVLRYIAQRFVELADTFYSFYGFSH